MVVSTLATKNIHTDDVTMCRMSMILKFIIFFLRKFYYVFKNIYYFFSKPNTFLIILKSIKEKKNELIAVSSENYLVLLEDS